MSFRAVGACSPIPRGGLLALRPVQPDKERRRKGSHPSRIPRGAKGGLNGLSRHTLGTHRARATGSFNRSTGCCVAAATIMVASRTQTKSQASGFFGVRWRLSRAGFGWHFGQSEINFSFTV